MNSLSVLVAQDFYVFSVAVAVAISGPSDATRRNSVEMPSPARATLASGKRTQQTVFCHPG